MAQKISFVLEATAMNTASVAAHLRLDQLAMYTDTPTAAKLAALEFVGLSSWLRLRLGAEGMIELLDGVRASVLRAEQEAANLAAKH